MKTNIKHGICVAAIVVIFPHLVYACSFMGDPYAIVPNFRLPRIGYIGIFLGIFLLCSAIAQYALKLQKHKFFQLLVYALLSFAVCNILYHKQYNPKKYALCPPGSYISASCGCFKETGQPNSTHTKVETVPNDKKE